MAAKDTQKKSVAARTSAEDLIAAWSTLSDTLRSRHADVKLKLKLCGGIDRCDAASLAVRLDVSVNSLSVFQQVRYGIN